MSAVDLYRQERDRAARQGKPVMHTVEELRKDQKWQASCKCNSAPALYSDAYGDRPERVDCGRLRLPTPRCP